MEEALADRAEPPDVVLVRHRPAGHVRHRRHPDPEGALPGLLDPVLTVYDDDERIFEALCAGACGYLLKKTPPARLLECLREAVERRRADVARSRAPRRQAVPRVPAARARRLRPDAARDALLKLLVEGHNYKTAADDSASPSHRLFHMRHIYEKLQVHSKSEAVAKALRSRLLD